METAHNFRNRTTVIGACSRRILRLSEKSAVVKEAGILVEEVRSLETHMNEFEEKSE